MNEKRIEYLLETLKALGEIHANKHYLNEEIAKVISELLDELNV